MLVFVDVMAQRVRTTWTKRSRGGPAATARNRVPVAFPLLADAPIHAVDVDESTGFEPRFRALDALDGVTLEEVGGALTVWVELAWMGRPTREWRPAPIRLQPGEWVRWQINYRFGAMCACGDQWHYRLETLNLAHGAVPDFTGEPSRTVIERGDLR